MCRRSDVRWFLSLLRAGGPGPSASTRMLLINRRSKALRFLRILGVVNAEGIPLVEELRGRLKNGERFIQLGTTYTPELVLMFCGVFVGTGCTKLILFFGSPFSSRRAAPAIRPVWAVLANKSRKIVMIDRETATVPGTGGSIKFPFGSR